MRPRAELQRYWQELDDVEAAAVSALPVAIEGRLFEAARCLGQLRDECPSGPMWDAINMACRATETAASLIE